MVKPQLHTLIFFTDDIETTACKYAKLLNVPVESRPHFNTIRLDGLALGFHPADAKAVAGTVVPYFTTEDLDQAVTDAASAGFTLHRGPIEIEGERIAQLRNAHDVRIGLVQKCLKQKCLE